MRGLVKKSNTIRCCMLRAVGGIETGTDEELNAARKMAEKSDVIVLALGESPEMSGEAGKQSGYSSTANST